MVSETQMRPRVHISSEDTTARAPRHVLVVGKTQKTPREPNLQKRHNSRPTLWAARPRRVSESTILRENTMARTPRHDCVAGETQKTPREPNLQDRLSSRPDIVGSETQKTPQEHKSPRKHDGESSRTRPCGQRGPEDSAAAHPCRKPIAGAPGTDVVAGKAQKTPRELKPCRDHDGEGPKTQRCGRRGLENSARAPNLAVNTPRERRGPTLQPVRSRKTPQEPKSSNSFDCERVDARLPRRRGSQTYSRA